MPPGALGGGHANPTVSFASKFRVAGCVRSVGEPSALGADRGRGAATLHWQVKITDLGFVLMRLYDIAPTSGAIFIRYGCCSAIALHSPSSPRTYGSFEVTIPTVISYLRPGFPSPGRFISKAVSTQKAAAPRGCRPDAHQAWPRGLGRSPGQRRYRRDLAMSRMIITGMIVLALVMVALALVAHFISCLR